MDLDDKFYIIHITVMWYIDIMVNKEKCCGFIVKENRKVPPWAIKVRRVSCVYGVMHQRRC